MPFPHIPSSIPTSLGRLEITMSQDPAYVDEDGNPQPEERHIRFKLEVIDQDGEMIGLNPLQGDLEPYLTLAEKTALLNFMNSLRARAETEILP